MHARGFTLVEILIVVVILAILAIVAVPHFAAAGEESRQAAAQTTLQRLRRTIEVFKAEHDSTPPQVAGMWTLLTGQSDGTEAAVANPVGTTFGPYLQTAPANPWNNLTGVSTANVDSSAGWYYSATTTAYTIQMRNVDGTINASY